MEIRAYDDVEDLRGATEARNRAWRVGFRGIVPESVIEAQLRPVEEEFLQGLREDFATEPGAHLVAEREGAILGYVRARYGGTEDYVQGLEGEIAELYVDPAQWRDGVGSALLAGAVDWLPPMLDGISSRVLAENDRARSFLEANDLVYEETTTVELAGEPFEHAIYRIGLED